MIKNKQILFLNKQGILIDSCDSLFSSNFYKGKNLMDYFPLLESIFKDLLENLKPNKVITVPGVETKHAFLPGYYDYRFSCISKNGNWIIKWQILDATESYNQIKGHQQSYNERRIFF